MAEAARDAMTIEALLAAAAAAGVEVRVEGERLTIRGPRTAEALGHALLERKGEVLMALAARRPATLPCPSPPRGNAGCQPEGPAWDSARAAAVVAEVERRIDAALAQGEPTDKPSRRQILANERVMVRRMVQQEDAALWAWPAALDHLLARWSERDGTGAA
jgi:hypothetical protein